MFVELLPNHGRDYKTAKADWKANKDFLICCVFHKYDGKPINREQAEKTSDKYMLRFCQKTKVCQA